MQWANGTIFRNNQLKLETIDSESLINVTEVEQFLTVKPLKRQTRFERLLTNFEDWLPNHQHAEYCKAHGLHLSSNTQCRHQLYEFQGESMRFIVPAFVLMEAFYKPNNHLLPLVFRPSNFDTVSYAQYDKDGASTVVIAPWARNKRVNMELATERIDWATFYPSARKSLHSIFQNAVKGRLDLALPKAEIHASFMGIRVHNAVFVSTIRIAELVPMEQPDVKVSNQISCALTKESEKVDVSFMNADSIRISDEEWSAISPLLFTTIMGRRRTLNHKHILEDILYKFVTGTHWHNINYQSGTQKNANYFNQMWRNDGRLAAALMELKRLRGLTI